MSFLQNFIHVTTNKLTYIAKPKRKATSSSGVACAVRSTTNWLPNLLIFPQNQFCNLTEFSMTKITQNSISPALSLFFSNHLIKCHSLKAFHQ
jgi:hypothetical protein